jgi:hypothetical protein
MAATGPAVLERGRYATRVACFIYFRRPTPSLTRPHLTTLFPTHLHLLCILVIGRRCRWEEHATTGC